MAHFRIHFKWKGKEINIIAQKLDMTHPYFVSIKDLVLPKDKKLIVNPQDESIRKDFSQASHLMIPFQSIILIEELNADGELSIMPFTVTENENKENS